MAMLCEIPALEFAAALDECAAAILWEAEIACPPVDARLVAERLGLVVAADRRLAGRARFARLAEGNSRREAGTIVVGPAERPEREQWAVAHEIGESAAGRVFEQLGVPPEAAPPGARETVANHLASRLLLPQRWFEEDGRATAWDLLALKRRYATASHELIARRMLEMNPLVVMTVCDLGRVTWRRSNAGGAVSQLLPPEARVWKSVHEGGAPRDAWPDLASGLAHVRCWPVHEPAWKREIIRSEISEQ
jgi:Zn-dependent peptidase ImmA (M78 family)